MKFIGHFQQAGQGLLSIGHDDGGWLQLDDAMHAALHGVGIRCACQIGNFAFTQYLQAVGVDVVEVVHQIGAGVCRAHGRFVELAFGRIQAGHPLQVESGAKSLKKRVGADSSRIHDGTMRSWANVPPFLRKKAKSQYWAGRCFFTCAVLSIQVQSVARRSKTGYRKRQLSVQRFFRQWPWAAMFAPRRANRRRRACSSSACASPDR